MDKLLTEVYEGKEPYIFISYSHRDEKKVYPVLEKLWKKGCRIWYDEGISAGSEWPEEIARHLKYAEVCILFLSEGYVASHNCRKETNYAMQLNKFIILVQLENVSLTPAMELMMANVESRYGGDESVDIDGLIDEIIGLDEVKQCADRDRKMEHISPFPLSTSEEVKTELMKSIRVVLLRRKTGEEIKIDDSEFYIGRSEDADYCISDNTWISGKHIKLVNTGMKCYIEDLGSLNFTYVNGERLLSKVEEKSKQGALKELNDGDELRLADEFFDVRIIDGMEEPEKEKEFSFEILKDGINVLIEKEEFTVGKAMKQPDYCFTGTQEEWTGYYGVRFFIDKKQGKAFLMDLGSPEETMVNGEKMESGEKKELKEGDELVIVGEKVRFRIREV